MNLSDLRERCALRFRDPARVIVTDAGWDGHLNAAYFRFVAESDFPQEIKTTTIAYTGGDRSQELPGGSVRVLSVRDATNVVPLKPLDGWTEYLYQFPDPDSQGTPTHYRLIGTTLHLFPTPDAATTVEIVHLDEPDPLSEDDDIPALPVRYHEALVEGALLIAYEDDSQPEPSARCERRFASYVAQAVEEMSGSRQGRYPTIQPARD